MSTAQRSIHIDWEIQLPQETTWEVLADTNRITEMVFNDKPSTLITRNAKGARMLHHDIGEYEEFPWVFEVPKRYKNCRVFSHKILKKIEQECNISQGSSPESNSSRVQYTITVEVAAGFGGALFLKVLTSRLNKGMKKVEQLLHSMAATFARTAVFPISQSEQKKLIARAEARVMGKSKKLSAAEQAVLQKIITTIASAGTFEVSRMRPYVFAKIWDLNRKEVLAAFLHACHMGILRLSWDVLCPSCVGAMSVASLKELPATGHCASCEITYNVDFAEVVEATFSPEPTLRKVEQQVYCLGSPKWTQNWLSQFFVEAKDTHTLTVKLGVGRYKLLTPEMSQPFFIDVEEDAQFNSATISLTKAGDRVVMSAVQQEDVYDNMAGAMSEGTQKRVVLVPGTISLTIENADSERRRVQLAWRSLAAIAATAADVTALNLYKELFGQDVLSPGQQVSVGQLTILFTDLVGSSSMYEQFGDVPVYGLIRRHFDLLFKVVEDHGGRVVKTVGDAVMAAFDLPEDGARAALECVKATRTLTYTNDHSKVTAQLALRVGCHVGPCLAITNPNGQIDYFGNTVNVASRVEGCGNENEVVLTHFVTRTTNVRNWLKTLQQAEADYAISAETTFVKGLTVEQAITRIKVL